MRIKMLRDENTIEGRLLMGTYPDISAGLAHDLVSFGAAEYEKEQEQESEKPKQLYDYYSRMTIFQLKVILRSRGLPVGGTKPELIERLKSL